MKKRVDLLLVSKKLVESRSKAQAMIMAGQVKVNGKQINKSGEIISVEANITIENLHPQWVSRGALKLLHALDYFKIDITDFICLDIGASTGGFSQVLLNQNVKKIYAVDVGKNQLHEKLRQEEKIINIPGTNARYLNYEIIKDEVDIIVCDVSFISMKKVILPSLKFLEKKRGIVIGLIKPQFESSRNELQKGGVILNPEIHKRICQDFREWFLSQCKMQVQEIIPSPIIGPKGNIEFLIYAKQKSTNNANNDQLR